MSKTDELVAGIMIVGAVGALTFLAIAERSGDGQTAAPIVAEATPPAASPEAPAPAASPAPSEAPAETPPAQETAAAETPAAPPAAPDAAAPPKESAPKESAPKEGAAPPAEGAAPPAGAAAEGAPAEGAAPPAAAGAEGAPAEGAAPAAGGPDLAGNPLETAQSAEKGSLKSPYADYASVAAEGHKKYMAAGCNGCHGGGGGGGMGPPLTNQIWIYGRDDDTLFRLIALGSADLQKQGYARKGSESVVGPMPPFGNIIKSNDDLWKIIAWIRSKNPSSAEPSTAVPPPPS